MTWRNARVARDGTHHEFNGQPLYAERFEDVLAFHAPGLAPVRRALRAWHIRSDGSAAYPRRFCRTFGFYEGAAAVLSDTGWHHIRPDGTDLYATRYAWCGNFQGGRCPVRLQDGTYLHVSSEGTPAYAQRWRYAGDFRDGMAVVQGKDGRSTHINQDGVPIHRHWYVDLDVFHKRYARARDDAGWMHVGLDGLPVYERRFAVVEPFYNGQARVERFDGGLEVIDETGQCMVEPRSAMTSDFAALSRDLVGYWKTGAICAGVELGIFDAIPATADVVAQSCGLSVTPLLRLLHALEELALVGCTAGSWDVTSRGAYLRMDHPLTLADAAIEYGRHLSSTWVDLPRALRKDGDWHAPDIFKDVANDAARLVSHHRMLQSYALHDYGRAPESLPLDDATRLIDAGGGTGILARRLVEHYPHLTVVLFDLPQVVDHARNLMGMVDRIEFRGGELLEPWPVQGDAVVLSRVLHDWDDEAALEILRNARSAVPLGGRLFIIEMLLSDSSNSGSLCDLHLLMATGGRERTLGDYRQLLEQARFTYEHVTRLSSLSSMITGVAK
jgi:hypothetical protein